MALKETFKHLRDLLVNITQDLEKAEGGNKAASQRVRTGTVKLEKLAKLFRKESIKNEKATKGVKKPSKKVAAGKKTAAAPKKANAKHHTPTAKPAAKPHTAKPHTAKIKAKPKAKAHKAIAKPRALSFRKATAKLPVKRASFR
jgi:Histone H1-like protein Hc1